MLPQKQRTIKQHIAEQEEKKDLAQYIARLITLYEEDGKKSGLGSLVAANDDHYGAKRNPNAETQLPIEHQILNELLKRGPQTIQPSKDTNLSILARLQDDTCLPKLESHLKKVQEKHEEHHRRKAALCGELHHLRTKRPQKPHNVHEPHVREAHCRAVREHAQAEAELHQQITQLGNCEQIH